MSHTTVTTSFGFSISSVLPSYYCQGTHWVHNLKFKGVAGRGSRTKGRRGGVRPKAGKKKVTPTNLRVEVVSDLPVAIVATSDEFGMCPCPGENAHTTNSNAKLFRRNSVDDKRHPNLVLLPSTSTLPSPRCPKPSGSAHLLSLLITVFPLTYCNQLQRSR